MKYIQIPDDGVVEKQIMNGDDLIGVCRIDLSYLPAEDVVPVVYGRWIERKSLHAEGGISAKCSACKKDVQYLGNPLHFCPNCGAKMRGKN